jgi:ParB family chromosome partitioning protein
MARLDQQHGTAVVALDPSRVKPARWMNRNETGLRGAAFEALKSSISARGGNVVPVLVRVSDGATYELIYGGRRLRACSELGLSIRAVVLQATISERDCFLLAEAENRARKDMSPYEQGRSYAEALSSGVFASQRKLAETIGVSHTWVSQSLAVAGLPEEIIACCSSTAEIGFRDAKAIAEAMAQDPDEIMARARALSAQGIRLKPAKLLDALTGTLPLPQGRGDIQMAGTRFGRWSLAQGKLQITLDAEGMTLETAQHTAHLVAREVRTRPVRSSRQDATLPKSQLSLYEQS